MVLFKLVKNNNKNIEKAYGKVYARPVVTQTIGISELAEHLLLSQHGFLGWSHPGFAHRHGEVHPRIGASRHCGKDRQSRHLLIGHQAEEGCRLRG